MEAHLSTLKNHSDSYLNQGATLKSSMLDSVLTGSICNFLWNTKPLASDLASIKSRINPFHFATPRNRSYLHKDRIENGRLLQQQELAGEDDAKKERRATKLHHDGQVRSYHDVQAVLCNMNSLGTFMVGTAYSQTFLAKTLCYYDKVLRSLSAQIWLDQNHKVDHLAHALVLDIANQVHPYAEVASRLDCRNAIKNNNPTDPQAFVGPYDAGMQIANKLSNLVPYVHLGDCAMAPSTFELFQNRKKSSKKEPSDKKPNDVKRETKKVAGKKPPILSQPEKKKRSTTARATNKVAWLGVAMLDSPGSPFAKSIPKLAKFQSCARPMSSTMSAANGATSVSCSTSKASMISNREINNVSARKSRPTKTSPGPPPRLIPV
jgi:hypothetical protein